MADEPEAIEADTGVDNNTAETVELSPVEQIAVKMGWKPQTDYKGDPDKWREADEYILTEQDVTKTLKSTVKELKGTVDRMANTSAKQTERALQQQAQHYEQMLEQAVEDGDKAAAKEARRGIADAERQIEQVRGNPEEEFAKDNPWFKTNRKARALAVLVSGELAADGASVEQQLKGAAEAVRQDFPELFDEPEKKPTLTAKPPQVNAPNGRGASRSRGETFESMPAEAKQAANSNADLFVRKFGGKREDYVSQYVKDYYQTVAG